MKQSRVFTGTHALPAWKDVREFKGVVPGGIVKIEGHLGNYYFQRARLESEDSDVVQDVTVWYPRGGTRTFRPDQIIIPQPKPPKRRRRKAA